MLFGLAGFQVVCLHVLTHPDHIFKNQSVARFICLGFVAQAQLMLSLPLCSVHGNQTNVPFHHSDDKKLSVPLVPIMFHDEFPNNIRSQLNLLFTQEMSVMLIHILLL
jgi:hypothetical protein